MTIHNVKWDIFRETSDASTSISAYVIDIRNVMSENEVIEEAIASIINSIEKGDFNDLRGPYTYLTIEEKKIDDTPLRVYLETHNPIVKKVQNMVSVFSALDG